MSETPRLSDRTLATVALGIARPRYDRRQLAIGVVHLGIGAFHRAHQAVVYDDLANAGDMRWGVRGVSLRSPDVRDRLAPQDGLFSVSVRDGGQSSDRIVGVVRDVRVAQQDPSAVIAAMAAPETHLVTLTVTEKGYHLDAASGSLRADDPDIAADIANPAAPRTAIGFIVAALALRRARGFSPFTAASLDNLSRNGAKLRNAVLALASHKDPSLADWIEQHGAFPDSMVDRIVPAIQEQDIAAHAQRTGFVDQGLVKTEPFTQWVIEHRFAGAHPDFAAAGVHVTASVHPWETAKLRMLNGAHSAIAYLGGLAGIAFVHEFVALSAGAALVEQLWGESERTLEPVAGLDVAEYRERLMARFRNPALQHRTHQIAMDGSQKLPPRLLAPIGVALERNLPFDTLALGVAAWIRWIGGRDDAGRVIDLNDPMAVQLRRSIDGVHDPAAQVAAVLALEAIFPAYLARNERFSIAVTQQLSRLVRLGARGILSGA